MEADPNSDVTESTQRRLVVVEAGSECPPREEARASPACSDRWGREPPHAAAEFSHTRVFNVGWQPTGIIHMQKDVHEGSYHGRCIETECTPPTVADS